MFNYMCAYNMIELANRDEKRREKRKGSGAGRGEREREREY